MNPWNFTKDFLEFHLEEKQWSFTIYNYKICIKNWYHSITYPWLHQVALFIGFGKPQKLRPCLVPGKL